MTHRRVPSALIHPNNSNPLLYDHLWPAAIATVMGSLVGRAVWNLTPAIGAGYGFLSYIGMWTLGDLAEKYCKTAYTNYELLFHIFNSAVVSLAVTNEFQLRNIGSFTYHPAGLSMTGASIASAFAFIYLRRGKD